MGLRGGYEKGEEDWGPAMGRLNAKQRAYVIAQLSDPLGNPTEWARKAGYSDKSEGCKVIAFHLERNKLVIAAVDEVARDYLHGRGPLLGISVMMRIAAQDGHPQQLKAAIALADRTGFHASSEHKVVVEDRRDPVAMLARVKELAQVLGIDPVKLLGGVSVGDVSREMKVIEHGGQVPEVEAGDAGGGGEVSGPGGV